MYFTFGPPPVALLQIAWHYGHHSALTHLGARPARRSIPSFVSQFDPCVTPAPPLGSGLDYDRREDHFPIPSPVANLVQGSYLEILEIEWMWEDFEQLDPALLATNEVFSDEDRNALKQHRRTATQSLAELNAEIALADLSISDNNGSNISNDASTTVDGLSERSRRKRRRKLMALIAACDVATAPHKYLPAELLSYIFALAFNDFPTYLPPSQRTNTPLVLCQICGRWRRVALDTPDLWANIVFRYEQGLDPYTTIDLVEQYFTRCGSLKPLSLEISPWSPSPLSITYTPALVNDHREVMTTVLRRLIVPYASRFWYLTFRAPENVLDAFLAMDDLTFPNLKSVRIQYDPFSGYGSNRTGPEHNASFFSSAPLLTDVEIHGFHHILHVNDAFLACPWSRLTRLCFRSTIVLLSQIHSILRQARRLEECTIHIATDYSGYTDGGIVSKSLIFLPHLQKLELTFNFLPHTRPGASVILAFFQPLMHLPSLKEMTVSDRILIQSWPYETLTSFLMSGACPALEVLQIENIRLPESAMSRIARALSPSLTTLLIGADNLLSGEIIRRVAGGALLPRLRCLSCRIDNLELAIRMIELRWAASDREHTEAVSAGREEGVTVPAEDGGAGVSESASSREGEEVVRPEFFMLEYDGQVISRDQALRVDALREKGVEINIVRGVGS